MKADQSMSFSYPSQCSMLDYPCCLPRSPSLKILSITEISVPVVSNPTKAVQSFTTIPPPTAQDIQLPVAHAKARRVLRVALNARQTRGIRVREEAQDEAENMPVNHHHHRHRNQVTRKPCPRHVVIFQRGWGSSSTVGEQMQAFLSSMGSDRD